MADDYYSALEVPRSATQDEIQKAYRRLARKYHPDLQEDPKKAKKNFQRIQQAYDVLGDEEKRKQYDRFGPGFEQMRTAPGGGPGGGPGGPFGGMDIDFSQVFGQPGGPGGAGGSGPGPGGLEELLRSFGMGGGRPGRGRGAGRGAEPPPSPPPELDVEQEITVPFGTAVSGGEYRVQIEHGSGKPKALSVKIPAGIEAGRRIRLRGQGRMGPDGSFGDLLVVVRVAPHPAFRREGNHLLLRIPITVGEAVRGTSVDIPTPHGTISLKVPSGSSSGRVLRAKGMGVRPENQAPGDLLAELEIVLPQSLSADDLDALSGPLRRLDVDDPRADISW